MYGVFVQPLMTNGEPMATKKGRVFCIRTLYQTGKSVGDAFVSDHGDTHETIDRNAYNVKQSGSDVMVAKSRALQADGWREIGQKVEGVVVEITLDKPGRDKGDGPASRHQRVTMYLDQYQLWDG